MGKSTVAKKLCSHYQIHHITVKDIIDEKFAQLVGGYLRSSWWKILACPAFASCHLHLDIPQEEIIKGSDSEGFGEEVAAAKRTRENLNRSMKLNDGQSGPVQQLIHVFMLIHFCFFVRRHFELLSVIHTSK